MRVLMISKACIAGAYQRKLEALACGTPVVCSNRSSLPEVAGDAALLVDPMDTAAFAAALERVLSDAALRQDLARRGPAQAARFSWDETARQTHAAYQHAFRLAAPPPHSAPGATRNSQSGVERAAGGRRSAVSGAGRPES